MSILLRSQSVLLASKTVNVSSSIPEMRKMAGDIARIDAELCALFDRPSSALFELDIYQDYVGARQCLIEAQINLIQKSSLTFDEALLERVAAVWERFTGGRRTYPSFGAYLIRQHPEDLLISYGFSNEDREVTRPFIRHHVDPEYLDKLDQKRYAAGEERREFWKKITDVWAAKYGPPLEEASFAPRFLDKHPKDPLVRGALGCTVHEEEVMSSDPVDTPYHSVTVIGDSDEELFNLSYEVMAYVKRTLPISCNFLGRGIGFLSDFCKDRECFQKATHAMWDIRDTYDEEIEQVQQSYAIFERSVFLDIITCGQIMQRHFVGNCGEMSALAVTYLKNNQDPDLDVSIRHYGDHSYICLKKGMKALVCDLWKGDILPLEHETPLIKGAMPGAFSIKSFSTVILPDAVIPFMSGLSASREVSFTTCAVGVSVTPDRLKDAIAKEVRDGDKDEHEIEAELTYRCHRSLLPQTKRKK